MVVLYRAIQTLDWECRLCRRRLCAARALIERDITSNQPDLELVLMVPNAGPMMDESTASQIRDLMAKGTLGAGFSTPTTATRPTPS